MIAFQLYLKAIVTWHPGCTANEIALLLGHEKLSANTRRYLRWLEDRRIITSKRVKERSKSRIKIYRKD